MPIWFFAIGVIHTPLYPYPLPSMAIFMCASFWGMINYIFRNCLLLQKFPNTHVWPICFALGMAVGSFQVNRVCDQQLVPELDGQVFDIQFQVLSIPDVNEKSVTFSAKVLAAECFSESVKWVFSCSSVKGQTIRLSWYSGLHSVRAGQIWQARVKLKRPRGFVNPQGFDYQAWLLSQNIVATGYVREQVNSEPVLIASEHTWGAVRQNLKEGLLTKSSRRFDRFWAALIVGDRSAIRAEDWKILQSTGTVHLMAISGLHIGLVAMVCFALGAVFVRFWGLLRLGSGGGLYRYTPAFCSVVGALYYAALAGFSIPTLRAMIACLIVNICLMAGVRLSAMSVLGICIAVLGLVEPLLWVNAGFWLSCSAVAVLIFSLGGRRGGRSSWAWINIQLVLAIGMVVPLVFAGQGVSLIGPVANLIAVPVLTLVCVPVLLLASIVHYFSESAAALLLHYLDLLFGYLWMLLGYFHSLPFSRWWPMQALSPVFFILGLGGSILLLSPNGLGLRTLGVVWLFIAAWGTIGKVGPFKLTVMDVGQGLAVVVATPEDTWVYDTGPQFSSDFDSGSRIIAPYLQSLAIAGTSLIVSHDDNDHSGGTEGLASTVAVKAFYYGEPIKSSHKNRSLDKGEPCHQGQSWQSGYLHFEVFWPPVASGLSGNRASCVVLMSYKQADMTVSVLFTGDIDRFVEQRIMNDLPRSIDILIAPHHGSNSSSSSAFIKHLNPKYVVFSAGFKNRYHHPSQAVVERYLDAGAIDYNTAHDGALVFEFTEAGGLEVSKTRITEARRWYR